MPASEPVKIRIASRAERDRVRAAYASHGYHRELNLDVATTWLAESTGQIVGIVRVAEEEGTLVLRGMRVAPAFQRRQIGTRLLQNIAGWLGQRECYCIPYRHLSGFYGQIGFVETDGGSAPEFLGERLADYRQSGLSVILMRRR